MKEYVISGLTDNHQVFKDDLSQQEECELEDDCVEVVMADGVYHSDVKPEPTSKELARLFGEVFINRIMNVGPAFTDIGFSLLTADRIDIAFVPSGGEEGCKLELIPDKIVFRVEGKSVLFTGYHLVQVLMTIATKFGNETLEQACKDGFSNIGVTPGKYSSDPQNPELKDLCDELDYLEEVQEVIWYVLQTNDHDW